MASRTRRREKQTPPPDDGDWLTTYADTITILMAFFVLLYAMSEIKDDRFQEVRAGIIEAFKGDEAQVEQTSTISDFQRVMQRIAERLSDLVTQGDVTISNTSKGVQMEFNSSTLYKAGSADIRDEIKPKLQRVATELLLLGDMPYTVAIEGHTDDTPIQTTRFPSNWELSTLRATTIVRFFITQGLSPRNFKASGYADVQPKLPNRTAAGKALPANRSKNRRIVLTVEYH
jgi:chemotaxis protein MotB